MRMTAIPRKTPWGHRRARAGGSGQTLRDQPLIGRQTTDDSSTEIQSRMIFQRLTDRAQAPKPQVTILRAAGGAMA